MTEVSTFVRIGVTMLIVVSVVFTIFCLWGIAREASGEYYEEQVRIVDGVDTELSDLYNAHIPIVQLLREIKYSDYYLDIQQYIVQYSQRTNGQLTGTNQKTYTSMEACEKDWGSRVGYLTNIAQNANGSYTITMRAGG